MQPNIVENSLTFDDGSTVRVHVIDASGRRCYAIASVDGVGFTTSAPKAGKLNVSNVDLTVTVAGQEDCSLAGD